MDYEANSTAGLSNLLMNVQKISVYQVQKVLFTNQPSIRNCQKMTNCEQLRTKCCVKLAATLTFIASTDVFLIKKMILKEGTPGVLKIFFLQK